MKHLYLALCSANVRRHLTPQQPYDSVPQAEWLWDWREAWRTIMSRSGAWDCCPLAFLLSTWGIPVPLVLAPGSLFPWNHFLHFLPCLDILYPHSQPMCHLLKDACSLVIAILLCPFICIVWLVLCLPSRLQAQWGRGTIHPCHHCHHITWDTAMLSQHCGMDGWVDGWMDG